MNVVCMAGTCQSAHQVAVKVSSAAPVALLFCLGKPSSCETTCRPDGITDLLQSTGPSLQLDPCTKLHDPWRRNQEVIGCADRIAGEKGKDLFLPAWQLGLQRGHRDFVAQEIGYLLWSEAHCLAMQAKRCRHIGRLSEAKIQRDVAEPMRQYRDRDALRLSNARHALATHMQQHHALV